MIVSISSGLAAFLPLDCQLISCNFDFHFLFSLAGVNPAFIFLARLAPRKYDIFNLSMGLNVYPINNYMI